MYGVDETTLLLVLLLVLFVLLIGKVLIVFVAVKPLKSTHIAFKIAGERNMELCSETVQARNVKTV